MKPIETAPKDGTHILGYGVHLNDCDDREVGFCEVYYYAELNRWYNITHYPSMPVAWEELPDVGDFKI